MNKILRFEATIQMDTIEKINDEFSKAECRVMYTNANRNGSFIEKEAVEKALPTIYNIPVIAEVLYVEGEKDFGTHGGKVTIDSSGVKIEQTTVPYGVVPESANPRWEMVDDKEYLVCDTILWTGRYEDTQILLEDENQSRPQSMEINVSKSFMGDDGYEKIQEFNFSALTILGSEVEPCFEESRIKLYSLEDDVFNHKFKEMVDSYTKFNKEGGKIEVKKIKKDEFTEGVVTEDIVSSEDVIKTSEDFEENKVDETPKAKAEEKFELSYKDKMQLLYVALPQDMEEETKESYKWQYTYVLDFTDSYVDYRVCGNTSGEYKSEMYRAEYSMDEEMATVDFETQEELFSELITKAEKEKIDNDRNEFISTLNSKIEGLEIENSEFSKANDELKIELETEKQFRLSIEEEQKKEVIDETIELFEKALSENEGFETIKENRYEMTSEDIEKECYVLIGKMNFKNNTKKVKKEEKTFDALSVENKEDTVVEKDSYELIKESYSKIKEV